MRRKMKNDLSGFVKGKSRKILSGIEDDNLTETIQIYLTKTEKLRLKTTAKSEERKMSSLGRIALRKVGYI
jgi:hypothetical protein